MTRALLRRPERLVLGVPQHDSVGALRRPRSRCSPPGSSGGATNWRCFGTRTVLAAADSRSTPRNWPASGSRRRGDRRRGAATSPPHDRAEHGDRCTLREQVGVPYVLGVSQLLPHKCQQVLIQALHLVQSVTTLELGLVLVGPPRIPATIGGSRTRPPAPGP